MNFSELLDPTPGPAGARAYLRRVQGRLNWVPREAIDLAVEHYQVPFTSLYQFVAFDPAFSLERRGERVLEVCQGLSCREAGSDKLLEGLETLTGLKRGQTAEDGSCSLMTSFCMGRCAIGPNVRVNGQESSGQRPDQASRWAEYLKKS